MGSGVISYLITLLGDTFANLDNAPIRLNALIIQEAFCEMSDLQSRIQTHYTRQVIQEVSLLTFYPSSLPFIILFYLIIFSISSSIESLSRYHPLMSSHT